jgi:hypothetical protein
VRELARQQQPGGGRDYIQQEFFNSHACLR